MYIKYLFAGILSLMLAVSILQTLPVPPWGEDVYPLYRSEYFTELDRQFAVVTGAFLGIKSMARPSYAWVFLEDIENEYRITVKVYDNEGRAVSMPGERDDRPSGQVVEFIARGGRSPKGWIEGGRYHSMVPLPPKKECGFCHKNAEKVSMLGVMHFSRDFSARNFYTRERVLIFITVSALLAAALFLVLRWVPGRRVKELFDK